ncbi:hypothetical protein TSUD_148340 [Trifolium subterraneum]|uniref:ATP-dependent DNA helicase n=1 Tax=Trifolium subterraneum TaxID=3900 RepID=A0A2Z6N1P6_TRISU|nr:hypothetical protein TSUD_148340 [Trifolium subterraneum]
MAAVGMEDDVFAFKSSIVKDIREALDNCNNPYVRTYNMVRDTLHMGGIPTIKLRILDKRGHDGRRYNLPTASEVAALIVGDFDSADFERDIIVEEWSGLLQRISTFEPAYWPLQYPLLFPRGEDGHRRDIEFRGNPRKAARKRQFITQLEWETIHQFLVDSFSTIESDRLRYLRNHQQELRADMYKGLAEAVLRGKTDATSTGKRIVLPATFVGSARCVKYFPKKFVTSTVIDADGYPIYRRRDNGVFIKKGESFVDNRSIKYLFKYVNKGHDRVTAGFYRDTNDSDGSQLIDEIKMYYDFRYLSASEAVWRIFVFDINYREPSVERLNFHLEDEQPVVYPDEASIEEIISKPYAKYTKFLAWMDANKKYPYARTRTYGEFPAKFVWNKKDRRWSPRKKGFSIGRLHFVPPGSGQKFYLRILLNYLKGLTSFDDIKTVDGVKYDNYKDTCFALGLMDGDTEFSQSIKEASYWGTDSFLRDMFQRQRRLLNCQELVLTPDQLKSYALVEIEMLLRSNNKSLKNYPDMPRPDEGAMVDEGNRLILDELNYDREMLTQEHHMLMSTMTLEQRGVYDKIMERIRIVLAVASSGIASLLIPGGRTTHSRFNIPFNVNECSTCEIGTIDDLAHLIRRAKLIIWDEAPIIRRTLKDIMQVRDFPFGGKVVVLGGDFRQILPVIPKGTRYDIVHATINSSPLWRFCEVLTLTTNMRLLAGHTSTDLEHRRKFSKWILGIGDGSIGEMEDECIKVHIPGDLLIPKSDNPLATIVENTYPGLLQNG